jgi:transposase
MSAPRKYDQEFRERAVRMYRERLAEPGESKRGARRHVGALLDLNPETLRNWAEERDRVESGRSPAPRTAESEEVRALRRRVTELERANEILKTSASVAGMRPLGSTSCGWPTSPMCGRWPGSVTSRSSSTSSPDGSWAGGSPPPNTPAWSPTRCGRRYRSAAAPRTRGSPRG